MKGGGTGKEESGVGKRRVERKRGEWRGKEESGEGKRRVERESLVEGAEGGGREEEGRIKEVSREKEGDVGRWER